MNELKFDFEGHFNAFLEDHLEYTKEYKNNPPSPHTPKYPGINTTADEEFNVYCVVNVLSEKELLFLYALINEIGLNNLIDNAN